VIGLFVLLVLLLELMKPLAETQNTTHIVKTKTIICIRLVLCMGSFLTISQTHPGHSLAFSLLNRLYTLQPIQIPNTDSKNKNIKHITHITTLMGHIVQFITTHRNIILASISHIARANLFCGAQTYSGFWLDTNNLQSVRLGEYLGLTKTLMIKSIKNAMTNNCMT
jgi:hypothetical protein